MDRIMVLASCSDTAINGKRVLIVYAIFGVMQDGKKEKFKYFSSLKK